MAMQIAVRSHSVCLKRLAGTINAWWERLGVRPGLIQVLTAGRAKFYAFILVPSLNIR